jgi:DNA repair photolyase
VLHDFSHPVWITTRGTLIERDIDLIAAMAARRLASVSISVTTLDPALARKMEPRAPSPQRRLAVIRALTAAGIPVRVQVSPLIPALTDHELEAVLEAAAGAGATHATSIPLRLPLEVADLFRAWLEATFPDRAARVMGRVRDLHGGRDYDPDFGTRMTGQGIWADLIHKRSDLARKRLGLGSGLPPLRTDLFQPPTPVRRPVGTVLVQLARSAGRPADVRGRFSGLQQTQPLRSPASGRLQPTYPGQMRAAGPQGPSR